MGNSKSKKSVQSKTDYKKIIDTLGPKSKLCYHNLPDDRKQTFLDECIIAKRGKFSTLECQVFLEEAKIPNEGEKKMKNPQKSSTEKIKQKLTETERKILDTIKRDKAKTDFLIDCTTEVNKKKKWNTYSCVKYRKNILDENNKKLVDNFFASNEDQTIIGKKVSNFLNCIDMKQKNCKDYLVLQGKKPVPPPRSVNKSDPPPLPPRPVNKSVPPPLPPRPVNKSVPAYIFPSGFQGLGFKKLKKSSCKAKKSKRKSKRKAKSKRKTKSKRKSKRKAKRKSR